MLMKYKVANIVLCVESDSSIDDKNWNKFQEAMNFYDVKIHCLSHSKIHKNINIDFSFGKVILKDDDAALVSNDWKNMYIFPLKSKINLYVFLNQIFYSNAILKNMIQVHSSLVQYKGRGVMFLGPSGIGKTTQAELWNQYLKALIINGDMVFVEKKLNEFIGWGIPWHGSSPYCENINVPIIALIVLKQGTFNNIRELTGFEKVCEVGSSIIYPSWVDNGTEMALDVFDKLMQQVPVYELTNKADEESVQLVKQVIFGDE